jgi:ribose-phosphate pyrophosphokinase
VEIALLAASTGATLTGAIARHLGLEVVACDTERFPDGEAEVLVGPVRGSDCYIVQSTGPPVDAHVMELALVADACRRAGAARVTAVIPYFGYARQDRRTRSGEAVGVRVVAGVLAASGLHHAVVVDPHVPTLEAILPMPTEVVSAWDVITDALRSEVARDAVIVAPDAGAVKLADRVARSLARPLALVRKQRLSGEQVSVTEVVGDVQGRPLVIVDDMISTAGTTAAAIVALLERGAVPDVVIAAAHGLLVGPAAERLGGLPVRRLVLTDTLPRPEAVPCPTTVVTVAGPLAETIGRLHRESSRTTAGAAPRTTTA